MSTSIAPILLLALPSPSPTAADRCSTGEEAATELRAVHETARRAHLEGKAELLAAGTADRTVLATRGDLSSNSRDDTITFFRGYFGRVKYLEWSDAAPPAIHVSPDGRMAWMAVKIRARYVERTKPATAQKTFRSSWIATYERVGCAWKMTGNASAVVDEAGR